MVSRPHFVRLLATAGALAVLPAAAGAQETVKIGFSVPLTGAFSENGQLYNIEFDKYPAVKDPFKAAPAK
jgi:hypothetical protein